MTKNVTAYYDATTAKYYDCAYNAKTDLHDVPFYVELAKKYGGPVLEIACGTGRILCEIHKLGIEIEGIDASPFLLSKLKDKLPDNIAKIHEGDMRDFELNRKFSLIIIPFRPLQHMYNIDDQIRALTCAKNHLTDDGILAFDVFFPKFELLLDKSKKEILELEWQDEENPEHTIKRYFIRTNINVLEQYFEGEFIFRTFAKETSIKETRVPLKMSYYSYFQMQLLLRLCNLEIVEEYGSFKKEGISVEKEMIFLTRKHKNK